MCADVSELKVVRQRSLVDEIVESVQDDFLRLVKLRLTARLHEALEGLVETAAEEAYDSIEGDAVTRIVEENEDAIQDKVSDHVINHVSVDLDPIVERLIENDGIESDVQTKVEESLRSYEPAIDTYDIASDILDSNNLYGDVADAIVDNLTENWDGGDTSRQVTQAVENILDNGGSDLPDKVRDALRENLEDSVREALNL